MDTANQNDLLTESVKKLENRLGELLALTRTLKQENQSLRRQHERLLEDRSSFHLSNTEVKGKVESLIQRLRVLENS